MSKETIRFHLASTELTSTHKEVLNTFIATLPKDAKIVVGGHACITPVVTEESLAKYKDNNGFSKARAEAVKNYLLTLGVDSGNIEVQSFGDTSPSTFVADTNANRRVEISV